MRSLLASLGLLMVVGLLTLSLSGCQEEGPAERAGRGLDEAGEEMRDAAEDIGNDLSE